MEEISGKILAVSRIKFNAIQFGKYLPLQS